ncbi:MAG: glycosyltransferase family 4 protein [Clostridiaceae bacterium]|nr:glycosyltransferase family 4 protein [Clostridiaceae bacterium]
MRILILTFYYEPDLCAGSFRTTAFVNELRKKIASEDTIDVLTTKPNRYHTYGKNALGEEKFENVTIRRFNIPVHKSGILDQAKSFLTFYRSCIRYARSQHYDLVFATSSRLFTAFLGYKIAKQKKLPLYLDIRDIFVDTLQSIYEKKTIRYVLPLWYFKQLEKKTCRYASRINLVSEGFKLYFLSYISEDKISVYSNGIDDDFYGINFKSPINNVKKIITYAGNIGDGQGLHKIIPEVAKFLGDNFIIKIIGAGGMRDHLEALLKELNIKNVILLDPISRTELVKHYQVADCLFLHLNNYRAFEKVLPSKIFEYGATGKPVIAGVSGFSKLFIHENFSNWMIFNPADINDFKRQYEKFKLEQSNPSVFLNKFRRNTIISRLAVDFLSLK